MDGDSLESIYRLYMKDVYRYLLYLSKSIYIAEDLTQDTFTKAFIYFENCPTSSIKPWLFKVAYNCYIDYVRKANRRVLKSDLFFKLIKDKKKTEDKAIFNETIKEVIEILDELPIKQKQAVLLCDFNNMSYKETAEILEVEANYVKVLLYRGRQAIKNKYERID